MRVKVVIMVDLPEVKSECKGTKILDKIGRAHV